MIYAGIGSRETPPTISNHFIQLGKYLGNEGWLLRSGRARGADASFEYGCDCTTIPRKEIFTVRDASANNHWYDHAARFHPNWEACSAWAKAAMARNSAIMLGKYLNAPVDFVVCWTKDGGAFGGTGQALRIAEALEIPVFNFYDAAKAHAELSDYLRGHK